MMPAYRGVHEQSNQVSIFGLWTMLLLIYLASGSEALARVNPNQVSDFSDATSILSVDDLSGVTHAHLVIVAELMPAASVSSGGARWTSSRILKEFGKQAVDQPGHFLIGAAPMWASRCLVGVPWFGWVAAPILGYREWLQWPSNRWWDPPLDWAFLTLGALAGTWSRRPGQRLAGGLAAIRQSMASELTVRSRMRHAG